MIKFLLKCDCLGSDLKIHIGRDAEACMLPCIFIIFFNPKFLSVCYFSLYLQKIANGKETHIVVKRDYVYRLKALVVGGKRTT